METFSFKPFSPGIRFLWFIQFKNSDSLPNENLSNRKLPMDLYIPSPFNNEWHNASTSYKSALESLDKIQKVCSEIKNDASSITKKNFFNKIYKKSRKHAQYHFFSR